MLAVDRTRAGQHEVGTGRPTGNPRVLAGHPWVLHGKKLKSIVVAPKLQATPRR
jgi:hypothetical protein